VLPLPQAASPTTSASTGSVASSVRSQARLRDGGNARRRAEAAAQQGPRTPAGVLRASATGMFVHVFAQACAIKQLALMLMNAPCTFVSLK